MIHLRQKSGYVSIVTAQIMSYKFYPLYVSIFYHNPATTQKKFPVTAQISHHCQIRTPNIIKVICKKSIFFAF
jgi:hypothetical protein